MPSVADAILDLAAECFDAPTLEALAKLRLSAKLAARVDRLADKANEGRLTPRERAEYQAYINTSELLAFLQLRARLKLGLPIPQNNPRAQPCAGQFPNEPMPGVSIASCPI